MQCAVIKGLLRSVVLCIPESCVYMVSLSPSSPALLPSPMFAPLTNLPPSLTLASWQYC